jgi:hypothetical protein
MPQESGVAVDRWPTYLPLGDSGTRVRSAFRPNRHRDLRVDLPLTSPTSLTATVFYVKSKVPQCSGLAMELAGFEPPTSWVRSELTKSETQLQKSAISRGLSRSRDGSFCWRRVADTQGYAAICGESGTPGEKCPKSALGGWNASTASQGSFGYTSAIPRKTSEPWVRRWVRALPKSITPHPAQYSAASLGPCCR